jgi:hypothetical protein
VVGAAASRNCLDATGRALASRCDFPAELTPEEERLIAAERAGFARMPAVAAESVPVSEIACPGGVCPALTADEVIAFRDGSHMTASYSGSLADDIAAVIIDVLAGRARSRRVVSDVELGPRCSEVAFGADRLHE